MAGFEARLINAVVSTDMGKAPTRTRRPSWFRTASVPDAPSDPSSHTREVGCGPLHLEPDKVGAQQPFQYRSPPRQLEEQLLGWEWDMQVEPDTQVGPHCSEHLRNQLQVVIVNPDGCSGRCRVRHGARIAIVYRHVRVPPLPVERRAANRVVIQRPEGGVREPEVELLELFVIETNRTQLDPRVLGWHCRLDPAPRPADPHTGPARQHRRQRGRQATWAQIPMHLTVAFNALHRQSVGDHDQLGYLRPGARLLAATHHRTLPTLGSRTVGTRRSPRYADGLASPWSIHADLQIWEIWTPELLRPAHVEAVDNRRSALTVVSRGQETGAHILSNSQSSVPRVTRPRTDEHYVFLTSRSC